jgi:hypothetical protein
MMKATAGRNMYGVSYIFILNRSHLTEVLFTLMQISFHLYRKQQEVGTKIVSQHKICM